MQIFIKHPALEQCLTELASAEHSTVEHIAMRILAKALNVALGVGQEEADRPGKIVLAALKRCKFDAGLTVRDICMITGWRYRTAADVLQRLLEAKLVVRSRTKKKVQLGVDGPIVPTGGAPAWHYRLAQSEPTQSKLPPLADL